jgi:hypothetical protein
MKKNIIHLTALVIFELVIGGTPFQALGQSTNKAAANAQPPTHWSDAGTNKVAKGGPFNGKLAAIDKSAKTIVVGKRTIQVTSETKIKKVGKPATLDEGVVGEAVSGYVKPNAEGKLVATTVNFGPKANSESVDTQKAAPEKQKQTK